MKPRILFILKQRSDYSTNLVGFTNFTVATGMYNSSLFVSDMLNENEIESKLSVVVDNNDIDREVTNYKPTHVIIEGFWVIPSKFDVLKKLHPEVKWIIRCHSELPFLSQEGNAIDWIYGYLDRGIYVSGNSPKINREIRSMAFFGMGHSASSMETSIPLLTNYYPVAKDLLMRQRIVNHTINIGCFGAIRPLKNQLSQALAAIEFAERHDWNLKFHINAGRIEMNGNNTLKNIRALFENNTKHELIEHQWSSHADFVDLLKRMDICMQVSFTETFNIVSADAANVGVPIVVSPEIVWAEPPYANPTSVLDIIQTLEDVLINQWKLVRRNYANLSKYSNESKERWLGYFSDPESDIIEIEEWDKLAN